MRVNLFEIISEITNVEVIARCKYTGRFGSSETVTVGVQLLVGVGVAVGVEIGVKLTITIAP